MHTTVQKSAGIFPTWNKRNGLTFHITMCVRVCVCVFVYVIEYRHLECDAVLYSKQNAGDSKKPIAFIGRVFYTLIICSWFVQNVSNYIQNYMSPSKKTVTSRLTPMTAWNITYFMLSTLFITYFEWGFRISVNNFYLFLKLHVRPVVGREGR
jgi:hypothetical protein